ncbi:MAG: antibiotic biosynthesis monooxygenase [Ginsengibacter sp.]
MLVRLTHLYFIPSRIEDSKKIFREQIVPTVRKIDGNHNIMLLEPLDGSDVYISMSVWIDKAAADAYQDSGKYKELVDLVKDNYSKPPVLKSYNVS